MKDERTRKLALGVGAFAAVFVTGTAIWTGNPGLFVLAGVSVAGTLALAFAGRRGG